MSIFIMPDGKAPTEVLDYAIDMTRELANRVNGQSDAISGVVWTVPSGLSEVTSSFTNTEVTIWLSGGTLGTSYEIVAVITTSNSRVYNRSFILDIVNK
jgi:hypothetical protein